MWLFFLLVFPVYRFIWFQSSSRVFCAKCCHCLWIVHSWMPIRFCLTFFFTIMYNRGINSSCWVFSKQDHIIGAVLIATCSGTILSVEDIAFDPWYFTITDAVWYTYRPYIYHTDIEYLINQSAIIYSTGLYQLCWNRIGVFAPSPVDHGFEPQSSQTKESQSDTCCFPA